MIQLSDERYAKMAEALRQGRYGECRSLLEGAHDDLVLALAMAVFGAENRVRVRVQPPAV